MKIDKTFESKEGAIVHIIGDLDFKLTSLKVTGFKGAITITGIEKCQNGTMHIEYHEPKK